MKNGKAPTKKQKIAIQAAGLNHQDWLVYKNGHNAMRLVHRTTGETKTITF